MEETEKMIKTRKVEFYKNEIEILSTDYATAKQMLIGMPKFKGKLHNYGPLTTRKTFGKHTEIDKFVLNDFEFLVITYESMSFSFKTMSVSSPELCTAVYWQRIK